MKTSESKPSVPRICCFESIENDHENDASDSVSAQAMFTNMVSTQNVRRDIKTIKREVVLRMLQALLSLDAMDEGGRCAVVIGAHKRSEVFLIYFRSSRSSINLLSRVNLLYKGSPECVLSYYCTRLLCVCEDYCRT